MSAKKIVIARLFIKDGSIEAFKKVAAQQVHSTRQEKGCLFYSLFEDVANPGDFLFYEEYADQAALDIHMGSVYLKNFRREVDPMRSKDAVVQVV